MKTFRRALFDRLVLSRRPSVTLAQMACAVLGSLGMSGLTARMSADSPLYRADGGETVELIVDDVLTPHVLATGHWQLEEVDFLSSYGRLQPCVLIDVGANIGLVTRQLVHRTPRIVAALCFEPHPQNFRVLRDNLDHLPQCRLEQAALGSAEGELRFYEDTHNFGNYSLNADAMRGMEHRTSVVRCLKASTAELIGRLPIELQSLPLIWKSDTQGFDEVIATSLGDDFWSRVQAGVMELWRIDRPAFDAKRLGAILSQFSVLHFGDQPGRAVSVDEVLKFTEGRDGSSRDLHFARAPLV